MQQAAAMREGDLLDKGDRLRIAPKPVHPGQEEPSPALPAQEPRHKQINE